jgi:chromosome segregation ATPase
MKNGMKAMLGAVGLVPAVEIEPLLHQARQAAERMAALDGEVVKLRADVQSWKQRCEESASAAAEWKHAATAATAKAERATAEAQRAEAKADDLRARCERLDIKIDALRTQLEKAGHAATAAREHLMATEVKLDLIEAAIHVLDLRTRDVVVAPS